MLKHFEIKKAFRYYNLIGTNFRGHLISRRKGRHILRVFIFAIIFARLFSWGINFRENEKKGILFREFHYLLKIINS